jgi:flagellar biosynthetic protein FliQ
MTELILTTLNLQATPLLTRTCAALLLSALAVGFVISLFRSISRSPGGVTISFVPKALGAGLALLLSGQWVLHELLAYLAQFVS